MMIINTQLKFEDKNRFESCRITRKHTKVSGFQNSLNVKDKVTSFKIIQDLWMKNTQLKFEVKIPNGSKVVTFIRDHTKIFRPIGPSRSRSPVFKPI